MKPYADLHIVYFGIYSVGDVYPRNRNLIESLRAQGCRVSELHHNMVGSHGERLAAASNLSGRIRFAVNLLNSYLQLGVRFLRLGACDAVVVGHPGYFHIHLARLLCACKRRRPRLILDIFIPLYNTLAEDRGMFGAQSTMARLLHRFEASACAQADLNLLDTLSQCGYIEQTFKVRTNRLAATYVGSSLSNTGRYDPVPEPPFRVIFVGTYIPLQGVATILAAAKLLRGQQDIQFSIVGCKELTDSVAGQRWQSELHNVVFIDWVETPALPAFMGEHHCALGIFGDTGKAARVIPTKVFDICKLGMPFISADTPAIREVFKTGENALLIPAAHPEALAEAILSLRDKPALRRHLREGVIKIQQEVFALEKLCLPLLTWLEND